MKQVRRPEFAKDATYESFLEEANAQVAGWGERPGARPEGPVLFVVGAPRSGTTLLYQILSETGGFGYPSNLIARFYRSPAWGARTQKLLAPILNRGAMKFSSRAGNTDGWWSPHEFGYFWEYHFDFASHHEPHAPDLEGLIRALAAFESEMGLPLLFKNPILCLVLHHLAAALPTSHFIWVKRPYLEVAESIFRTRIKFHGESESWLSLKPEDAPIGHPVPNQIAHQVARAHTALTLLRDRVGPRFAEVDYEAICRVPAKAVRMARELTGASLDETSAPSPFAPSTEGTEASIRNALEVALREEPELADAAI